MTENTLVLSNKVMEPTRFTLQNFSGPLDLLVLLVQKEELELLEISLRELFLQRQPLEKEPTSEIAPSYFLDEGADFVAALSQLIYLKALRLAPQEQLELELDGEQEEQTLESHFIEHLLQYCAFKQAAKTLAQLEEDQKYCFLRPKDEENSKPASERIIKNVSLEEFSKLFSQILANAKARNGTIWEEEWKVADKIFFLRNRLAASTLRFNELFLPHLCRGELIVLFLAVLELMKNGEIQLLRIAEKNNWIFQRIS